MRNINNLIFWGMKKLWVFFFFLGGGVITKLDYLWESFLKKIRAFSLGQGTEWEYFLGLLKFQIIFCFGVNSKCWVQAYRSRIIECIPPSYDTSIESDNCSICLPQLLNKNVKSNTATCNLDQTAETGRGVRTTKVQTSLRIHTL